MRDHERWVDCLKQDLQDLLGFSGCGEDLLTQVGSDERWTRVCECECWVDCLEQDLQDLLGFSGCERLREEGLERISWDSQDGGG